MCTTNCTALLCIQCALKQIGTLCLILETLNYLDMTFNWNLSIGIGDGVVEMSVNIQYRTELRHDKSKTCRHHVIEKR